MKDLRILGIRGIPAAHGGFETFAEHFSRYLVEHGWRVTVYCQEDGEGPLTEDTWQGIRRVRIPIATRGALGTILFDLKSTLHAAREPGPVLTLGYNTAFLWLLYRLKSIPNIANMDGIEWRRGKWGALAKAWFWLNDWAGCLLANHLIADHPGIETHLATRAASSKITMIPYGADRVDAVDEEPIKQFGLSPGEYAILIARAEPENSILEVVSAWSHKPRGRKLVVLGNYASEQPYQRTVLESASSEVVFLGAIYDKSVVQALRYHALFYVHGHQVGGTNPSLVEALGAGNPVLAHDNQYNRWVAGEGGVYFRDEKSCSDLIDTLLQDTRTLACLGLASRARHASRFTWHEILGDYEQLILAFQGTAGRA